MCDLCVGKGETKEYDVFWRNYELKLKLCNNCWMELQFNLNICEKVIKKERRK